MPSAAGAAALAGLWAIMLAVTAWRMHAARRAAGRSCAGGCCDYMACLPAVAALELLGYGMRAAVIARKESESLPLFIQQQLFILVAPIVLGACPVAHCPPGGASRDAAGPGCCSRVPRPRRCCTPP